MPHQFQPSGCVKIPQLIHIAQGPVSRHIVYHDLKYPIKHAAGNDMAHLLIQLRNIMSKRRRTSIYFIVYFTSTSTMLWTNAHSWCLLTCTAAVLLVHGADRCIPPSSGYSSRTPPPCGLAAALRGVRRMRSVPP